MQCLFCPNLIQEETIASHARCDVCKVIYNIFFVNIIRNVCFDINNLSIIYSSVNKDTIHLFIIENHHKIYKKQLLHMTFNSWHEIWSPKQLEKKLPTLLSFS